MNRNRGLYIGIGAVVLIGLLLLAFFSLQEKRYNWTETYDSDGTGPYDLHVFTSVLETYFNDRVFTKIGRLHEDTAFMEARGGNFVYVSGRAFIDSVDADRLIHFAEKGNTVFISASNNHEVLTRAVEGCGTPNSGKWVRTRKAKRIRPYLTYEADTSEAIIHYQVADDLERYPWPYYDIDWCSQESVSEAGSFTAIGQDYINYIAVDVGNGRLLLHSTPLVFANYHFIRPEAMAHAERVLSLLYDGDVYFYDPDFDFTPPPNRPLLTESPLRFILGNEALRWAWYLVLALAFIYVLNTMRRRERSIPVQSRPPNETLKFIDVMTRFYQKEGNHKDIAALQLKLLMSTLRNRYGIAAQDLGGAFQNEVSDKLAIPLQEVSSFFQTLHIASHNSTLSDKELEELDQKITEFYAKCP